MTNFLSSGIIKDTINDICQKTLELKNERDFLRLKRGIDEIEEMALELALFLEKLSCDPLIYTGPGHTEEVIMRLNWALTFGDDVDPVEFYKFKLEANKRNIK